MARTLETASTIRLGPGFLDDLPMTPERLVIADKYSVIETIGRGGMGVVYKASQENLNRVVAVKMMLGGVHAGEDFKRRFLQEAKAAARLNHPNIVSVHDWGEEAGQPFFSMDFIDGHTLADMAREQPMAPRAAAEMVRTISEAMHYAHTQGVLHRDLKPSNVLVDSARVPRITDFGLARQINQETALTNTGQFLGTPGYLPPEQVSTRSGQVGPRSDVYGLGAILYYLLTSRPPHVAGSPAEALRAVEEEEPVSPRRLNPSVPVDLETICLKCLEKNPDRRYASAEALANDLQRWLHGEPIGARPVRAWERGWKWAKRRPVIASLIVWLVFVHAAALVTVTGLWRRAEAQRRAAEHGRTDFLKFSTNMLTSNATALGGLLEGKSTAESRRQLAMSQQILEKILELDPKNPEWKATEGMLQYTRGEMLVAEGDLDGALEVFQKFQDTYRYGSQHNLENASFLFPLLLSYSSRAGILDRFKDFDATLESLRRFQSLAHEIAAKDPTNFATFVTGGSQGIYTILLAKGQYGEAWSTLTNGLAIQKTEIDARPTNETAKVHSLIDAYADWGEVARGQLDARGALYVARENERLIEQAYARGLNASDLQTNAVKIQFALGMALSANGQREAALAACQRALLLANQAGIQSDDLFANIRDHTNKLHAVDEKLARVGTNDPVSQHQLGEALEACGDRDGALAWYEKSVVTSKRLLRSDAENISLLEALARGQQLTGSLFNDRLRFALALNANREFQNTAQRLVAKDTNHLHYLTQSYRGVYRALGWRSQNPKEALRVLKEGSDLTKMNGGLESTNESVRSRALEDYKLWIEAAEERHHTPGALHLYREINSQIEQALERSEISRELQDLAIKSHAAIGKILIMQKHNDQALEEYQRALALAEKFGIKDEDPLSSIRAKVKELEEGK